MTALELISLVNQVLFVGLFLAVLRHAVRQASRASFNTLLLLGSIAAIVLVTRVADLLGLDADWVTSIVIVLLALAPFAMLRLVDDYSGTPDWVQWAGGAMFLALSALGVVALETQLQLVEIVLIAWFVGVGGYAAMAFAQRARLSRGITRHRMTAVAIGAILFVAAIAAVLAGVLFTAQVLSVAGQVLALGAAFAFLLGFAPPAWVRRAWREPDLRRFFQQSVRIAGLDDDRHALSDLQRHAADTFGASGASIGIWNPGHRTLRYVGSSGEWLEYPDDQFIAGQAFAKQRRVVALDAPREDPEHAAAYEASSARTVISAPMTLEDRRLGVLSVYADRAPIFIDDDLWLMELLADQAAVLIEARTLAAEAATVRSREEAARLKEEFLSAAAHDLRTPLTVVLGQAELLERRAARDPTAPIDAGGVARIVREARRLRDLVSQLLDVQRLEQGSAVMDLTEADLRGVVAAVHQRFRDHGLDFRVDVPDRPVIGSVDRMRMEQVLDNLVENALKYTANGTLPELRLAFDGGEARVSVVDHGVGIPDDERERIFERFYRASNAQSITDTGMGLGLYICRRIVEAHGGRIWVEETPGGGSTFVATLPAREPPSAASPVPPVPAALPASAEAVADA